MAFNEGNCLWVRGIPIDCQKEDLLKIFRSYGRVANVHIPNEPLTRCHKGYAFVTMTTSSEAQDCIRALHCAELGGQRLLVEVAKRSTAYAKTPGIYLGTTSRSSSRPAEPGLLRDEAALAEPLSEPASAAATFGTFGFPSMEPMEPGGEPLTEEDPVPSPFRRCEEPPMPLKSKEVSKSPRSRISQLEAANVRAAAQQTADSLLLQFQRQGFADPHHAAAQCLQRSLELLGSGPTKEHFGPLKEDFSQRGPQAVVAPDEFKNPSTFLPESMQDGNWRCDHCGNVNFPRRQRCNKCQGIRGPAGDAIVLQYAARVYEMLKGRG